MLDYLGVDIPADFPMEALQTLARKRLQDRIQEQNFPPHYMGIMSDLYGFTTGVPMTTGEASAALTERDSSMHMTVTNVYLAEKHVLGLTDRKAENPAHQSHPERGAIEQEVRAIMASKAQRGKGPYPSFRQLAERHGVSPSLVNKISREIRSETENS